MKNIIKKIVINLLVAIVFFVPLIVLAQTPVTPPPSATPPQNVPLQIDIPNPLKGDQKDLMSLVVTILNSIVMPIASVLCVLWIIYAGFKFVTAQGNPGAVTKARDTLLWALIGTGILLGAAGISQLVQRTVESVVKVN